MRKSTLAYVPGTLAKSGLDGILLMQCSQLLWTNIKHTGKMNKMKDPSSYCRQQNPLRFFLMALDGPERRRDDSRCTDLLLETSELMVGPSDSMQHAAVPNNFPAVLSKSLLENSVWSFENICFSYILRCVSPWILLELCWYVCGLSFGELPEYGQESKQIQGFSLFPRHNLALKNHYSITIDPC